MVNQFVCKSKLFSLSFLSIYIIDIIVNEISIIVNKYIVFIKFISLINKNSVIIYFIPLQKRNYILPVFTFNL